MDFDKRLEKAISRGEQLGQNRLEAAAQQALTEEQLRRLHSQYRLELSEHIERCLRELPGHFPGFRIEAIADERGWGSVVSRDDLVLPRPGQRENLFSRLLMLVRPFSNYHVLEVTAKGTIHNKELFNRAHYQLLAEVELPTFIERIDAWVLEYAEMYAASSNRR